MSLINLRNICLSFSSKPVFSQASLAIEPKERVCILGRNGAGKSTLMSLLHGDIDVDSGEIVRQQTLVIAKLEQEVPQDISGTVYDCIASVLEEEQLWERSYKIDDLIAQLGLSATDDVAALSGGLKRRVLLGQACILEPDILLLDEPTNHLDVAAIEWLEKFVLGFKGTVIFITHDRAFLKKLATRIIEVDRGSIYSYPGDYDAYLTRKAHDLAVEAEHNKQFDKNLSQEEAWIRQGIKARRTRNEGRVRALKKLRQQRSERREVLGKASMQLQQAERSGKIVIEATNISYQYPDKKIIQPFSTTILRGDKIGLIGPNGMGKTTLLKILLGELKPQSGQVKQGTQLKIAYFDQLRTAIDETKSVAENVSYGDQYVNINGRDVHIIGYLQDFLFTPERARSPVRTLSGGERNRLLLARLFTQPANLLVLDEPTNDLDLETLELLEELLVNYEGTVLLVSHDRQFLDNVVTSTLVFEGDGIINEYVGGYEDWLRQAIPPLASQKPQAVAAPKPVVKAPEKTIIDKNKQKELRAIEKKIETLEIKEAMIHEQLADTTLYEPAQATKLSNLQKELVSVKENLFILMEQWENLA